MFNYPFNNRINRSPGEAIGRGPSWRKGSQFDRGRQFPPPLDRNDRAACCTVPKHWNAAPSTSTNGMVS